MKIFEYIKELGIENIIQGRTYPPYLLDYKESYEELEYNDDDNKNNKKITKDKIIELTKESKDKITKFFTQKHNKNNKQYDEEQYDINQYENIKQEPVKNNKKLSKLTDNSCDNNPGLCSETNTYLNSYINNSF